MAAFSADYNVDFVRVHESGGHFVPMEEPDTLVADLRASSGRSAPPCKLPPIEHASVGSVRERVVRSTTRWMIARLADERPS